MLSTSDDTDPEHACEIPPLRDWKIYGEGWDSSCPTGRRSSGWDESPRDGVTLKSCSAGFWYELGAGLASLPWHLL
jgi:uncharacterized protein (DUF169 family)